MSIAKTLGLELLDRIIHSYTIVPSKYPGELSYSTARIFVRELPDDAKFVDVALLLPHTLKRLYTERYQEYKRSL